MSILVLVLVLSYATVAHSQVSPASAPNPTQDLSAHPFYVPPNEGMKLHVDEVTANPEAGKTGGHVVSVMLRSGIKHAWARVQVLVDARGQVEGVQSIDGTPAVLSAVVQEVRRYRFKPYMIDGSAVSFVTVLKLDYSGREEEPACSLANRTGCR